METLPGQPIANDPDHWDNLNRLDRSEFYPDDRDHRVNFETIKSYPRDHHFYSSNRGEIVWPWDTTEAVCTANGQYLKRRYSPLSSSWRDAVSAWNISSLLRCKIERISR